MLLIKSSQFSKTSQLGNLYIKFISDVPTCNDGPRGRSCATSTSTNCISNISDSV